MLILASLIVSLVAIAILTVFMVISIDRISREVATRSRHNMSRMLDEYDDAIRQKRNELLKLNNDILSASIEKKTAKPGKAKEIVGKNAYSNFENEPDIPVGDIYKTIKNNYLFDLDRIANSILVMKQHRNNRLLLVKGILQKIHPMIFMEMDTLENEEQIQLLSEYLSKEENDLIKELDCYGIDLFERLKIELNQEDHDLIVYVASEEIQETLKKHDIESVISPDLVEGLNIMFNGKLYEYSVNRKELY